MILLILISLFAASRANQCYTFPGTAESYISFEDETLDLNESSNIALQFQTSHSEGILYYVAGVHDVESLYIKDGKLHYFLWNQFPNGTGSSFGARKESTDVVDDGEWHNVKFYKNSMNRKETGMTLDGVSYKDKLRRSRVVLQQPIYFGGYSQKLNVGSFNGRIRNIRHVTQGFHFDNPTSRGDGDVSRGPRCED